MGALIYSAIASVDGYTEDTAGNFGWAAPDEEVHAFVNQLERSVGTYLYGRRMYETMSFWEDAADLSPVTQEYADIWRAADKIVYSRTLGAATTQRTRLEHDFSPESIRQLKASSPTDLSIGGAELGGEALKAGLVDEVHLILAPMVVGGGKRALPAALTAPLTLVTSDHFASGFAHLHYKVGKP